MQDEQIDVGEGCFPAFLDYNGDGLMDLVLGNYGYYRANGQYLSELMLFENTGTPGKPSFKYVSSDYAGLSAQNVTGICPAFGDLDGDGDPDLICGMTNGKLMYFTNTAGPGQAPVFLLNSLVYSGIDVGQFSTPVIIDLNGDGLNDLVTGEAAGNLDYFENTGSLSSPLFSSTPTQNMLGNVDVMKPCCTGYSSPVFGTLNGKAYLLTGSENGNLFYFDQVEGNLNGTFNLLDSNFLHINQKPRMTLAMADLNGDGKADLAIGNYNGGLAIYYNETTSYTKEIIHRGEECRISPNPADNSLLISVPDHTPKTIEFYNTSGLLVFKKITEEQKISIKTSDFECGLYAYRLTGKSAYCMGKILIIH